MSVPVSLFDLTEAFDLPPEWGAWLDRERGVVVTLDPETLAAGEDAAADELGELVDEAMLAAARAIAAGDPRYLALPDGFDFHEHRHMERFVHGLTAPRVAEELARALRGAGTFGRFKDTARRLGVIEDWFTYRQATMERHMLEWAEANGVAVDRAPRR